VTSPGRQTLVGVAYRREVAPAILAAEHLDCIEILVEHFVPFTAARRRELSRLVDRFLVLPHAVSLNLGSSGPLDHTRWTAIKPVVDACSAPFLSDHAAITASSRFDLGHLSPIWRTDAGLAAFCRRTHHAQEYFEVPLAAETITEPFRMPNETYSWDTFARAAWARSGVGLLIDVTNIFINVANGVWTTGFESLPSLVEVPWYQFHIAGYERLASGVYVDRHNTAITEDLYAALASVASVKRPLACVIERDAGLDDFDLVLGEVAKVQYALNAVT